MMRSRWRYVRAIPVPLLMGTMVVALACSPPPAAEKESTETPSTSGAPVTIELTAQSIAFSVDTITVPAGAEVTVNFTNNDGFRHNFAVYETSAAAKTIFRGETITGKTKYLFTAPTTPGEYFFRCDVHPGAMTGKFIVTGG